MFIHLHTHSDYSMLNGVIKVEKLVKKAKEYGMPAIALTDNGSMYSAFGLFSKCKGEGIKPIFGVQVYLAPRTRFDKESKTDEKTSELVLLAKNLDGYHNLIKIVSKGHIEGFYYRPRVDKDLLKEHAEGIIVLSGGENGEIFKNYLLGNSEKAKEIALWYKEIFGENFFIEIQRTGLHSQEIVNPKLIELSKEINVPLVATNDVYYEKQEDAEAREVLWCIDGGRLMSDPARKKPESNQQYFRSAEEMEEIFKDLPEAIENTIKINEKVEEFDIGFGKVQPVYPGIPEGETEESYLRKLVFEHGPEKYGYWTPELIERIEYELKVIHDKGYDGYFLVVYSMVNWARSNGIMVSTRGSAAGAAVSFAIGITTLDPVKWGLVFERFLNPERKSLPDIDLDISDNRRDEVINWVKETYGFDNFANVGALGKLTTKAAIRDVSRVLGIELPLADKLSKLVPVKFGRVTSMNACISDDLAGKEIKVLNENRPAVDEFRKILKTEDGTNEVENLVDIKYCPTCFSIYYNKEKIDSSSEASAKEECKKCHEELKLAAQVSPKFANLVKYVQKIEGGIRNVSTHACGHLITPTQIIDYCPVQIESGSGKRVITQFEGKYLEDLGLMKFDFLGLANLSIIDNSVKFIKEFKGLDIDIFQIPQDDKKAFELLQRGDTTAVFQLESAGMRKYLKELKPETMEEISAMVALYRPGPIQFIPQYIERKHGREEVSYLIPELEPILKDTFGFAIYQEQILRIASDLCGYTLGAADNIRKAVGKKIAELMASEEKKFKEGFLANFPHYSQDIANKLWDYVLPFADYGFNKAHSAAYAFVAYLTAYLKANYPSEFAAALMLSDIDNQDKLVRDILDTEARGIKLLPPDINKSDAYFKIEEEGVIRFGIGGLKGVGLKCIQSIVDERRANGDFKSLDDLCTRIDHKICPKGAIEALIKIGAMSEFGSRAALLKIFEDIYVRCQKLKSTTNSGFIDMFGGGEESETHVTKIPDVPEVDDLQKIQWEREILGVAITPSLLQTIIPFLRTKKFYLTSEVKEQKEKNNVRVLGQIASKRVITTKNGDEMCFIDLSDASGKISVTLFPKTYAEYGTNVNIEDFVQINGKTQKRNDEMQLLCDKLKIWDPHELTKKFENWAKKHGLSPKTDKSDEEVSENSEDEVETESPKISEPEVEYSSVEDKRESTSSVDMEISVKNPDQKEVEPEESIEKSKIEEQRSDVKVIEFHIKKDALIEDLQELNTLLKQSRAQSGAEIFIFLPNHESIRKIKLEGFYLQEVKNIKRDIVEKIVGI